MGRRMGPVQRVAGVHGVVLQVINRVSFNWRATTNRAAGGRSAGIQRNQRVWCGQTNRQNYPWVQWVVVNRCKSRPPIVINNQIQLNNRP